MAKEAVLWCVLVAFCIQAAIAGTRVPIVQVYTRHPPEIGKPNILQCYVDQFHPPQINVTLLKNGKPMDSQQNDLSFQSNWAFCQLFYTDITVEKNTEYGCKVEHETLLEPKIYKLDLEY